MKNIKFYVIDLERRHGNSENYADMEILAVADEGEHPFNLTRFRRENENKIVKGHWYQGGVKESKKEGYNDIVGDVEYLTAKDGIPSPFWPQANEKEMDARQKSILVQSDMRTAAILTTDGNWATFFANYGLVKKFREEQEAQ